MMTAYTSNITSDMKTVDTEESSPFKMFTTSSNPMGSISIDHKLMDGWIVLISVYQKILKGFPKWLLPVMNKMTFVFLNVLAFHLFPNLDERLRFFLLSLFSSSLVALHISHLLLQI